MFLIFFCRHEDVCAVDNRAFAPLGFTKSPRDFLWCSPPNTRQADKITFCVDANIAIKGPPRPPFVLFFLFLLCKRNVVYTIDHSNQLTICPESVAAWRLSSNAFTDQTHTNYHFVVHTDWLALRTSCEGAVLPQYCILMAEVISCRNPLISPRFPRHKNLTQRRRSVLPHIIWIANAIFPHRLSVVPPLSAFSINILTLMSCNHSLTHCLKFRATFTFLLPAEPCPAPTRAGSPRAVLHRPPPQPLRRRGVRLSAWDRTQVQTNGVSTVFAARAFPRSSGFRPATVPNVTQTPYFFGHQIPP